MNVTKDGVEVKVGQVWRDLDTRMFGRMRRIVRVESGKAVMDAYTGTGRETKVSISRMHKHSTGWELVNPMEVA